MEVFDDAIVGAGILGLAHAYHLGRAGRKVVVFETGPKALQASVRNFGMIWPIGQAPGDAMTVARRSADIWREVLEASGLWHAPVGSLHLAYRGEEAAVLREFVTDAPKLGFPDVEILEPSAVQAMSSAVVPNGLVAGMYSPTEINVDPGQIIDQLPAFLHREYGVRFVWNTKVLGYTQPAIHTSGECYGAEQLFVCSGADLQTLYPAALNALGLLPCKLQMLRLACPAPDWKLGPMLAAGLTLQHYGAFANCPSLPALKALFAEQMPEYNRWGIHVMASQNSEGGITIGDSHVYGPSAYEPFDREEIDDLILRYLSGFLQTPGERQITARWNGLYMKHPQGKPWVVLQPDAGVTCVTGVGGAGMTLSFGLAERTVMEALA